MSRLILMTKDKLKKFIAVCTTAGLLACGQKELNSQTLNTTPFPEAMNKQAETLVYEGSIVSALGKKKPSNEDKMYKIFPNESKLNVLNLMKRFFASNFKDSHSNILLENINELTGNYSHLKTELAIALNQPNSDYPTDFILDKIEQSEQFVYELISLHDIGSYQSQLAESQIDKKYASEVIKATKTLNPHNFELLMHTLRAARYEEMRKAKNPHYKYAELDILYKAIQRSDINKPANNIETLETALNEIIIAGTKLNYILTGTETDPQIIVDIVNYLIGIDQIHAVIDDIHASGIEYKDIHPYTDPNPFVDTAEDTYTIKPFQERNLMQFADYTLFLDLKSLSTNNMQNDLSK